jgi:hypothetical protein
MRPVASIIALLICAGCHVQAPVPTGLRASGAAQVDVRIDVRARVRVRAEPQYQPPPPPEVRPTPVPLEGAAVVEFFGVPLEGAQDVIFLLDRSGSMTEPVQGRIAALLDSPPAGIVPPEGDAPHDVPVHAPVEPYDAPLHAPPPSDPSDADVHAPTEPLPHAREDAAADPADAPADASDDAGLAATSPPMDASTAAPDERAIAPAAPRKRKIDVARRELIEALTQLPEGTRLNVLFFSDWLEVYSPGLFPLEESHRDEMIRFVERIEPRGPTALATAMRAAFLMGARHIVLLSDGLGNRGGGLEETLRDAREAMRGGVRIDTIGIGPDHDRRLLRALAEESGGLYQAF